MIYVAHRASSSPAPSGMVRDWFAEVIERRLAVDDLVFAGLVLWEVCERGHASSLRFIHRIEVEMAPAGGLRRTGRETIRRLLSENEFRACAREVRAL